MKAHAGGAAAGRELGRRSGLPGLQYAISRHAVCGDGAVDARTPDNTKAKETGTPPTRRRPRHSPPTTCRCFCNNSTSSGIWRRSRLLNQIRNVLATSDQPLGPRSCGARAGAHGRSGRGAGADQGRSAIRARWCRPHRRMRSAWCFRAGRRLRQQAQASWPRRWRRPTRARVGERPASSISISGI